MVANVSMSLLGLGGQTYIDPPPYNWLRTPDFLLLAALALAVLVLGARCLKKLPSVNHASWRMAGCPRGMAGPFALPIWMRRLGGLGLLVGLLRSGWRTIDTLMICMVDAVEPTFADVACSLWVVMLPVFWAGALFAGALVLSWALDLLIARRLKAPHLMPSGKTRVATQAVE